MTVSVSTSSRMPCVVGEGVSGHNWPNNFEFGMQTAMISELSQMRRSGDNVSTNILDPLVTIHC